MPVLFQLARQGQPSQASNTQPASVATESDRQLICKLGCDFDVHADAAGHGHTGPGVSLLQSRTCHRLGRDWTAEDGQAFEIAAWVKAWHCIYLEAV